MQNAKNTARSHKNSVKTTQNTQVFCIHYQKNIDSRHTDSYNTGNRGKRSFM